MPSFATHTQPGAGPSSAGPGSGQCSNCRVCTGLRSAIRQDISDILCIFLGQMENFIKQRHVTLVKLSSEIPEQEYHHQSGGSNNSKAQESFTESLRECFPEKATPGGNNYDVIITAGGNDHNQSTCVADDGYYDEEQVAIDLPSSNLSDDPTYSSTVEVSAGYPLMDTDAYAAVDEDSRQDLSFIGHDDVDQSNCGDVMGMGGDSSSYNDMFNNPEIPPLTPASNINNHTNNQSHSNSLHLPANHLNRFPTSKTSLAADSPTSSSTTFSINLTSSSPIMNNQSVKEEDDFDDSNVKVEPIYAVSCADSTNSGHDEERVTSNHEHEIGMNQGLKGLSVPMGRKTMSKLAVSRGQRAPRKVPPAAATSSRLSDMESVTAFLSNYRAQTQGPQGSPDANRGNQSNSTASRSPGPDVGFLDYSSPSLSQSYSTSAFNGSQLAGVPMSSALSNGGLGGSNKTLDTMMEDLFGRPNSLTRQDQLKKARFMNNNKYSTDPNLLLNHLNASEISSSSSIASHARIVSAATSSAITSSHNASPFPTPSPSSSTSSQRYNGEFDIPTEVVSHCLRKARDTKSNRGRTYLTFSWLLLKYAFTKEEIVAGTPNSKGGNGRRPSSGVSRSYQVLDPIRMQKIRNTVNRVFGWESQTETTDVIHRWREIDLALDTNIRQMRFKENQQARILLGLKSDQAVGTAKHRRQLMAAKRIVKSVIQ